MSFGAPHIAPPFDVIELLPEERKDLLRKLRQHADDARALAVPFEEVLALRAWIVSRRKMRLEADRSSGNGGFGLKPDDRRVERLRNRLLQPPRKTYDGGRSAVKCGVLAQQAALRVLAASEGFPRHGVPGGWTLQRLRPR